MKKTTSVVLDDKMVREIAQLDLSKSISRSGIFRVALSEFIEREKLAEKEKINKPSEK